MAKNDFLYLLLLTGLFWSFISTLDRSRLKEYSLTQKVSDDQLQNEWGIAEVIDIYARQELTTDFNSTVFQFLSSGGFVAYEGTIIRHTGSWSITNDRLEINYDDKASASASYQIEMIGPEELLIFDGNLQIRLLRME